MALAINNSRDSCEMMCVDLITEISFHPSLFLSKSVSIQVCFHPSLLPSKSASIQVCFHPSLFPSKSVSVEMIFARKSVNCRVVVEEAGMR
jgi:hypothetical protein